MSTILLQYLKKDNILFDAEAKDYEEAVRIAGGLLVKSGAAKDSYVDAMVEMARNYHYIVLAPGVAMPHARPQSGALSNSLSIVKLRNGVNFGHPEHDPVYIVLGLVALSENDHIDVMEALAAFLGEENNIQRLIHAKSREELLKILE